MSAELWTAGEHIRAGHAVATDPATGKLVPGGATGYMLGHAGGDIPEGATVYRGQSGLLHAAPRPRAAGPVPSELRIDADSDPAVKSRWYYVCTLQWRLPLAPGVSEQRFGSAEGFLNVTGNPSRQTMFRAMLADAKATVGCTDPQAVVLFYSLDRDPPDPGN